MKQILTNKQNKKWISIILSVFIILKLVYKKTETNDLFFLLKPVKFIVETITGTQSVYQDNKGYYFPNLQIIINKSCSGYNYWLLSYILFALLGLYIFQRNRKIKLFIIPGGLFIAYFLTIISNSSRIITAIYIQQNINYSLVFQPYIHEAIGVLTYLIFLIIAYKLLFKSQKILLQ